MSYENFVKSITDSAFVPCTVDIIIEFEGKIVLIERKFPPLGWAIPGGFLEKNESLEEAAAREAKEETGLDIVDLRQFHAYSQPGRDPRFHTVSVVFSAKGTGLLKADTDAKNVDLFDIHNLPDNLAFDHDKILKDYRDRKE